MSTQTLQTQYAEKIEKLEKELLKLKKGNGLDFNKAPISLKGILKGLYISLQDIEKAKKSLFRKADL